MADALGIGHALRDRPSARRRPDRPACASPHCRQPAWKCARAVAGAAAEFRLQHDIAARGQELRFGIPFPGAAAHDTGRRAPAPPSAAALGLTGRHGDVDRDRQAVARRVMVKVAHAHLRRLDVRVAAAEADHVVAGHRVDVVGGRLAVRAPPSPARTGACAQSAAQSSVLLVCGNSASTFSCSALRRGSSQMVLRASLSRWMPSSFLLA